MDTGIVRAWVDGWVISRGAVPPVEEPWGFTVDVGLPQHVTRHVLPDADEALVRRVLEKATAPGTWLKLFVPAETVAPWLTPGWTFDDPHFLMSTTLRPSATDLPVGYQVRTWSRGDVARVLVLAADGSFAARGQAAGPTRTGAVVFDQIETSPVHRRRGLGRAVMHALMNEAIGVGARTGVLGATVEGRGLYESLGWTTEAPLTSICLTSPPDGAAKTP
ncbi:GNAT family N-acetyltransferase [Streptomyces atriruber]|uniref:GNAT family N-acetyltransferase n=1 Tax=Streptomyces atriruber TaxID=545121 RepID=UPI0006E369E8|nr:GNAT family N-acetyltransferase [Streptomyces atriruber]